MLELAPIRETATKTKHSMTLELTFSALSFRAHAATRANLRDSYSDYYST